MRAMPQRLSASTLKRLERRDAEDWSRIEPDVHELPGGQRLSDKIRSGSSPWPAIRFAAVYCTGFPADAFRILMSEGEFDIRWPLSFAGGIGRALAPPWTRSASHSSPQLGSWSGQKRFCPNTLVSRCCQHGMKNSGKPELSHYTPERHG
jgi:hypothetical protein